VERFVFSAGEGWVSVAATNTLRVWRAPRQVRSVARSTYSDNSTERLVGFNSLDAQREAGGSDVISQRNDGWRVRGGSVRRWLHRSDTDRLALQRLMSRCEAGKINSNLGLQSSSVSVAASLAWKTHGGYLEDRHGELELLRRGHAVPFIRRASPGDFAGQVSVRAFEPEMESRAKGQSALPHGGKARDRGTSDWDRSIGPQVEEGWY